MKFSAINKLFSDKVLEYMTAGYVINSKSMAGNQGEEGKVDLVKGDELIRIYLDTETSLDKWSDPNAWNDRITILRVGRWKQPAYMSTQHNNIVWMSELEILEQYTFYKISEDWYEVSKSAAIKIRNKRHVRFFRRRNDGLPVYHTCDNAIDIAVRYLKRVAGYKRILRKEVKVQKYTYRGQTTYSVMYYSMTYILK